MLSFMETSLGKKVRITPDSLNDDVATLVGTLRTTFSGALPSLLLQLDDQDQRRELIVNFDSVFTVESVERAAPKPASAKSAPESLFAALTALKDSTVEVHSVSGRSTSGKLLGFLDRDGCFVLGLDPYKGKAPPMNINWKNVYYLEATRKTNPPPRAKSATAGNEDDPDGHGTGVGARLNPPDDSDHALASIGAPHEGEEQRRQKP